MYNSLRVALLHGRMASSKVPEKYIFAPAGGKTSSTQAEQYLSGKLDRTDLQPDPFDQFSAWFSHAQSASVHQPETVCLSTASLPSGAPSSRFVYLKELDRRGFVIYSNWETSRKAADIQSNPQASLAFWWREVERQVRVEGMTERLTKEESQKYFSLRARGSKIGAWASKQTSVLDEDSGGRTILDRQVQDMEHRLEGVLDEDIEVPDFWGGLRVVPEIIEFWQGRESRLHDRFRYTRQEGRLSETPGGLWKIERLSP